MNSERTDFRPGQRSAKTIFPALLRRVLVAAVGIPLMVGAAYAGGCWLLAVVLVISAIGQRELYGLARAKGLAPLSWWGIALGSAIILAVFSSPSWLWGGTVLIALALFSWMVVMRQIDRAIARTAATLFGVAYVPLLLSYMILLRGDNRAIGFYLLLQVFTLVWINDTAAYFIGMRFGKLRLAPAISPKKSVEGFIAGLAVTCGASIALRSAWLRELPPGHAIVLGAGIVLFGTLGDLFESLLKRDAGVKDAGTILPGHGGILDRFDSLLFALPFAYWYCRFFVFPRI